MLSVPGMGPQAAGDQARETSVLINLGALASDRGDRSPAEVLFAEALELARSLGDPTDLPPFSVPGSMVDRMPPAQYLRECFPNLAPAAQPSHMY
jgi:hypothetical protein